MKHFPATIDSPRVYLRLLTSRDAAEFYALTNDPKIAGIISFLSYPVPRKFADDWIAKNMGVTDRIYGAYATDNRLVGTIGAHETAPGQLEIGYWVGSAYMGQGYASEMVKAMMRMIKEYSPAATVFAECLPDNAGSWRVLEKNGFVSTGEAGTKPGRVRLTVPKAA